MKKNLKVTILIGLPASGKSTYAKQYLLRNPDTVCVNRDQFRFMFRDQPMTEPKVEDLITELVEDAILKALMRKLNVIIDATNLKMSYINKFIDLVQYKADVEFYLLDTPLETCLERDSKRDRVVGETIIRKMYKDYKILVDCLDFSSRTKKREYEDRFKAVPYDSNLEDAVLFDIDGTLALMGRRSPFDWNKVDVDDTNDIVIEQINFHRSLGRQIILISGRDMEAKEKTVYWLNYYDISYDYLLMRPKDDMRKDTVIKREIYQNQLKGKFNIMCVYDDRLQVLKMWEKEGIFCFNVNQGNKLF